MINRKKNPSLESVLQEDRVSLSCKGEELSLEKSIADNGIVYGDSIDIIQLPEPVKEEEASVAKETDSKEMDSERVVEKEMGSEKEASKETETEKEDSTISDSLARIKSLEETLAMVTAERDSLRTERDSLQSERDSLQSEITSLKQRLAAFESKRGTNPFERPVARHTNPFAMDDDTPVAAADPSLPPSETDATQPAQETPSTTDEPPAVQKAAHTAPTLSPAALARRAARRAANRAAHDSAVSLMPQSSPWEPSTEERHAAAATFATLAQMEEALEETVRNWCWDQGLDDATIHDM